MKRLIAGRVFQLCAERWISNKKVGSSYGLAVKDIGSRQEFGLAYPDNQRMLEISKK